MSHVPSLQLRAPKKGDFHNRYCGPAVVSAIANVTTGEAARLLRRITGRRAIKGTGDWEIHRALRALGFDLKTLRLPKPRCTLAAWLKATKAERISGRVFLIAAGHHWQLISGRRYTCGAIGEIISIRDKRVKRRARVQDVYEVVRAGGPSEATKALLRAPVKKSNRVPARIKRLAEDIGADIEREDSHWMVWPPETVGSTPRDPYDGDHEAQTVERVIEMVERYAQIVAPRERDA